MKVKYSTAFTGRVLEHLSEQDEELSKVIQFLSEKRSVIRQRALDIKDFHLKMMQEDDIASSTEGEFVTNRKQYKRTIYDDKVITAFALESDRMDLLKIDVTIKKTEVKNDPTVPGVTIENGEYLEVTKQGKKEIFKSASW